eukprot:Nk52_evm65s1401 gene=Nk52_evmTU65s1401
MSGGSIPGEKIVLFLFCCIAIGAAVKYYMRRTPVPYTVLLMVIGLGVGSISANSSGFESYTTLASIDPHLILYIFLPTLLFESGYALEVHLFKKTIVQVFFLAGPGLLMCTLFTAILAFYIFQYEWSWLESLLFGSLISATDPVAVVAILKEVGASKVLGTVIEGESLLNDGFAIVLFEVFFDGILPGNSLSALDIFIKFIRVAIGGPVFGFLMGQLTVFWIGHVYNDALTEITITLVCTYLVYWLAEFALKVSGVLAVVVMAIILNSKKTSISHEVETFLHRFWEMMGYLANTILFIMVGVLITERAFKDVQGIDVMFLFALYFGINVIRGIMIFMSAPILTRTGYGCSWQSMVVMAWGGLRGAVGLALALVVATDPDVPFDSYGSRVLFHAGAVVMLTLCVNATTMKGLLALLGMSEITNAKKQMMKTAVRQVNMRTKKAITVLKTDRFLSDSHWAIVESRVELINPYAEILFHEKEDILVTVAKRSLIDCPHCGNRLPAMLSPAEVEALAEDARKRFIKGEKRSYWRQYEDGGLGRDAVLLLQRATDEALDHKYQLTKPEQIEPYWGTPKMVTWAMGWIERTFQKTEKYRHPPLDFELSRVLHMIVHTTIFELTIYALIFANLVTIIIEFEKESDTLKNINLFFVCAFGLEAIVKIIALGKNYFKSWWNVFDFLIVLVSIMDVILDKMNDDEDENSAFSPSLLRTARVLRVFRIGRILRLLRITGPILNGWVISYMNTQLSLGYSIGLGYTLAQETVQKLIHIVTDNEKVGAELKKRSTEYRLEVVKSLGMIRQNHPTIAFAIKTQKASKVVLSKSLHAIEVMLHDGVVDEPEAKLLRSLVEINIKKLESFPSSLPIPAPEEVLENVTWLKAMEHCVVEELLEKAELKEIPSGEQFIEMGTESDGIFIVASGLIRVHAYTFEDYLGPGAVIGEMGVLKDTPRGANVTTESECTVYFLPSDHLWYVMLRYPALNDALWSVAGIRQSFNSLIASETFSSWNDVKVRMYCEKGIMWSPISDYQYQIEDMEADIVLLYGECRSSSSELHWKGPAYIPRSCRDISFHGKCRAVIISEIGEYPVGTKAEIEVPEKYKQIVQDAIHRSRISGVGADSSFESIPSQQSVELDVRNSVILNETSNKPHEPPGEEDAIDIQVDVEEVDDENGDTYSKNQMQSEESPEIMVEPEQGQGVNESSNGVLQDEETTAAAPNSEPMPKIEAEQEDAMTIEVAVDETENSDAPVEDNVQDPNSVQAEETAE